MSVGRTVPFFNYPALFGAHEQEFIEVLRDVLGRGAYILQKDLFEFETRLEDFLGVKHALGVGDGTNALILGLRALNIGPGDEVILPSHTYIASAAAVHLVGATPVLADIGLDHMVDPASVECAVTERTRAIMPVQLNGRTCDMDALQGIVSRHDHELLIVEDAAQALGSRYKGKCAGTFGAFGMYSFYPAKVLGCFGDGGAIVTDDDALAEKIGLLRNHGRNAEGHVVAWGMNCRLDNVQAAVLNFKFKAYDREIARRREIARMYHEALKDIEDLALPPGPDDDPDRFDVYQNYELEAGQRDTLRAYLSEKGIGTNIQWAGTPVHRVSELGFEVELPNTDRFFERCFMLPMNTSLGDEDVAYIRDAIRSFYGLEGKA